MITRIRAKLHWIFLACFAFIPLLDQILPQNLRLSDSLRPIFVFAILGLGVNIVTGFTGLLHLGAAGFMAIGAYVYAILTCDIYPFQLGFLYACAFAMAGGALTGYILGLPTLRLRGDYLAIVTLGFGEIVQSLLRNLDIITKGTQGINPLPAPKLLGFEFGPDNYLAWYFLFLVILTLCVMVCLNLERSASGRSWVAVREDELASACMGLSPSRIKLSAFAFGSALCALSGALWAAFLGSSGEPGNYDFQVSVIALCIVIVGGLGSIVGVLLGAVVMIGFNSIVLVKISDALARAGIGQSGSVYLSPNNWKYIIFGLALVLMMRYRPAGLLPPVRAHVGLSISKPTE